MSPEEELKALEMISGMPVIPNMAPMVAVTVDDPFLKLPQVIADCAAAIGRQVELRADGRIHHEKYSELLDDLGIKRVRQTIFKVIRNEKC